LSTKQGDWAYKKMSFGLKTALATFQAIMNSVLSGLTGSRCFVFLDDVVIYANLQGVHPVVLVYTFFHCPSEHNNYQQLIYTTCANGFISATVLLYVSARRAIIEHDIP
jgi:hypothetical protein